MISSSGGSTDASTLAPIKVPDRIAPTCPPNCASFAETDIGCSKVPNSDATEAAHRTPGSRGGGGR